MNYDVHFNCFVISGYWFCYMSLLALSNAFIASFDLFNLVRASPLLYQAFECCGSISIALSYAFIASSNLPNFPKATPLLFQAAEYCGFISIASA